MIKAAVITVSDGCAAGLREDISGPSLARLLKENGWEIRGVSVVPDEIEAIQPEVRKLLAELGKAHCPDRRDRSFSARCHT